MRILRKCMAVFLCLVMITGQAAALSPAERFERAASIINLRGLIAEEYPITQETIAQSKAYLEEHPEALSNLLNDILGGMDTHSMYLTAEEYQAGFSTLSGYAGVGIAIRQDEQGTFVQTCRQTFTSSLSGHTGGRPSACCERNRCARNCNDRDWRIAARCCGNTGAAHHIA